MTPAERELFLEQRSKGLGGSDIASLLQPLLSEVRYGCRRRLWYDKSRIPADYPEDDTGPMRLGRILEPHIAEWHTEATGDVLTEPGLIKHPDHPELLVNIDRIITNSQHDKPGVAEIKAFGPDMFWQTKREGILVDYLLQLQHGLLCAGLEWGKFIVGNRAYGHSISSPPLAWEQERDPQIHEAIIREGPAFWKTLGNPEAAPPRLNPDDKRCSDCTRRQTCQGAALVPDVCGDLPIVEDMRPLLEQYDALQALLTEKLPDGTRATPEQLRLHELKDEIKAAMGDRQAVGVMGPNGKVRKIYYKVTPGRESVETAALIQKYETLRRNAEPSPDFPPADTFKRQGVPYRTMRIY